MSPDIRPPHLRWAPIALVAAGGAVGAASREGLSLVIPQFGEVPISIAIINVLGAFLLGYLYEAVTRLDGSNNAGRNLRLLLGTGFCGGFTTYSALAADTAVLALNGLPWPALAYSLGTVVVGAGATWLGLALASHINSRMRPAAASGAAGRHAAITQGASE